MKIKVTSDGGWRIWGLGKWQESLAVNLQEKSKLLGDCCLIHLNLDSAVALFALSKRERERERDWNRSECVAPEQNGISVWTCDEVKIEKLTRPSRQKALSKYLPPASQWGSTNIYPHPLTCRASFYTWVRGDKARAESREPRGKEETQKQHFFSPCRSLNLNSMASEIEVQINLAAPDQVNWWGS